MFAITGVTGKVGGQIARKLRAGGHNVRAVVRDREKGKEWLSHGCEVAVAGADDAPALTEAFRGADGMFLLMPPNYDPEDGFADTQRMAASVRTAIEEACPKKVIFLSTVGAQVYEYNLLNNSGITEAMLRTLNVPVAFLRAAWFMENAAWDIADARGGIVHSFLQPLSHRIAMVATADIASTAVDLFSETWKGVRIVELEGPERYSANDVAAALSEIIGSPVNNEAVPRASWEDLFLSQGMKNPLPRMRMLDGFNEGWIDFEFGQENTRKGSTTLTTALQALVSRS